MRKKKDPGLRLGFSFFLASMEAILLRDLPADPFFANLTKPDECRDDENRGDDPDHEGFDESCDIHVALLRLIERTMLHPLYHGRLRATIFDFHPGKR